MNNVQKPYDATNSSSDSSSIIERLSYILTTVESNPTQQHTNDIKLIDRLLVEENASLKQQSNELTLQKQTIKIGSDMVFDNNQQIIEGNDDLHETPNPSSSDNQNQIDQQTNENIQLKAKISHLKAIVKSQEKQYHEQIDILTLRISELEDWNKDSYQKNVSLNTIEIQNKDYSDLQSRYRQLENDLQRLRSQQQHNQLALERLDEYEETISQLQEELNQLRSNRNTQQIKINEDINHLLMEERQKYDTQCQLLEKTRKQCQEKLLQNETKFNERFEQEKLAFENQLQTKDKQIEIERNEREKLEQYLQQLKDHREDENRLKEIYVRELLERQIIELNEQIQSLENDKNELNNQIDELQQQLRLKDALIRNSQISSVTPGAPPTNTLSSYVRDLSSNSQISSDRLTKREGQLNEDEERFHQIYNQFRTLLPCEYSSSDDIHLSLLDRFNNLFEQFSTYISTFSIMQEEFDSLKQILSERQDEVEKLRAYLELTTGKLTKLHEEESLSNKNKSFESDEDELEDILELQQRSSSRQSLLSITPGEKQQLIAQNELLSSLLKEKEQELTLLQQTEKINEDFIKNLETLKLNLQQMELDNDTKQTELNDIRNVLDEKLRENSSLKKEKMYFIDRLAQFERERQEQQSVIHMLPKQLSPDREQSSTIHILQQNIDQNNSEEEHQNLNIHHLESNKHQHDTSISYYDEYLHIQSLYNDLCAKYSQLEIDYKSIQSLIQQKNEAYLQCQNELNTYQNLLYYEKKKSDDIDFLRSQLNEREIQLQELVDNKKQLLVKQTELECHVKLLEEDNFKLKTNQQIFEQIQLDLKRTTHERDLSIVEKKQIENEIEINREKFLQFEEREKKLSHEVERLTQIEKSLRNQLEQLENLDRGQKELTHQFNINDEQSQRESITKLETLQYEYEKMKELNTILNNQLQDQIKCLENLQNQQEREQHVDDHLFQSQYLLTDQTLISVGSNHENNECLEQNNEVLSTVCRLNDELKAKDLLINKLENEINYKNKQMKGYDENFQTTNSTRIEKQLVKNILLSYFQTPIDKQQEVIPLLGALVGFTEDEYQKTINAITNNYNHSTTTSWFTGWLSANTSKARTPTDMSFDRTGKSFTELLIQYVDQQSADNCSHSVTTCKSDKFVNHQNPSQSTFGNSMHSSSDKQLPATNSSISANVEQDINIPAATSHPTSFTNIDDVLTI